MSKEAPTWLRCAAQAGIDSGTARNVIQDMEQRGLVTKTRHSISISDQHALARDSCAGYQLTKDATDGYVEALARLSRAYAH